MAGELYAVAGIAGEADDKRSPVVSRRGLRARRSTFGGITEAHGFLCRLRLFAFVTIWLGSRVPFARSGRRISRDAAI
jgi:hypothetical protein